MMLAGLLCDVLCQRSSRDASAAGPSRHNVVSAGTKLHTFMWYGIAVASHAPVIAVEDRGIYKVGVLRPIPVRLIAFVVTFLPECCFVREDVEPMPVHD